MVDMVREQNAMTIGVQPAIDASILLDLAQTLDVFGGERAIGLLFPGAAALDCGAAFIGIVTTPSSSLSICCLAALFVIVAALSLIFDVTMFTDTSFSIWICSTIEEARIGHRVPTMPAAFQLSVAESLLFLAILFSVWVSSLLATLGTVGGIAALIVCVFVKLSKWLDCIASWATPLSFSEKTRALKLNARTITEFTVSSVPIWGRGTVIKFIEGFKLAASGTTFKHVLASVRKSVVLLWGKVGTENLLFSPSAYPQRYSTKRLQFCQVGRYSL